VRSWPRFRFNWSFLSATWRVNGSYFGNGLVFYINSNIDLFIIGRQMGAAALGYYQNARALTDEIRARIGIPLQRVLFPAFSVIQSDLPRFQEGVKRSGRLLALVVIPIGMGIAAVAEELVPVLYGSQWLEMIPILKIIAAGAGIRAATAVGIPIFNATNQVGLALRMNAIAAIAVVASILVGSLWGVIGVAYALLFGALLNVAVYRMALALIKLRTRDLWDILGTPIMASTLMIAAVAIARELLAEFHFAAIPQLAILVAIGVVSYGSVILLTARSHVTDFGFALGRLRQL
jgi:O-antigen/teichoic acid export membrane protein